MTDKKTTTKEDAAAELEKRVAALERAVAAAVRNEPGRAQDIANAFENQ